ncbi:MAG TPA: aldehyde ferredoxin oxidoreductase family protein [Candidatus Anoxymicrobiaceae bacterium]
MRPEAANGNWGRVLRVDLTTGELEDLAIEESAYRDFLGGSGLAAHLFFKLKGYQADPLSAGNPLIVMNGPLSGTSLPGCSRLEVCARSPLTGIWGESSMGGTASAALKRTGYDGIVFVGASDEPVYLFLTDGRAELRKASHVWGEDTFETELLLKREHGDAKAEVMCIGPAGENLVRYASVVNDRGSLAGRSGMGAVMGSKKLKAIVVGGKSKCPVADPDAYKAVRKLGLEEIKKSIFADGLSLFGTAGGVELSAAIGDVPVKNWRQAQWSEGAESLSGVRLAETILKKSRSCYACPVACKRIVEIHDDRFGMEEGPGPEYEGLNALGMMLKIDNLNAVVKANALCNAYGMDCISTGGTIAYATEAFEEGLITERETGGITLGWNRPDVLIELVRGIAMREGFGDQLAEGCRAMAERYGGSEFAIEVKGMECPMHDPRALWSMALGYATSIRGACHNRDTNLGLEMGMDDLSEIGFERTKPHSAEGKAMMTVHSQDIASVLDSAVMCIFAWKGMGSTIAIVRDMVNAVTGYGLSNEELLEIGKRIWYLKRAIGNLCGATTADDRVPPRIVTPHEEGEGSDLLRALNPLIRVNAIVADRLKNEKLLKLYRDLNSKVLIPRSSKTIKIVGKLIAPFDRRGRASKGTSGDRRKSNVEFDIMLEEYYRARRLNDMGYPEQGLLDDLGLADVAELLYQKAAG